jgi:murein L,D-transpeptidase YafK
MAARGLAWASIAVVATLGAGACGIETQRMGRLGRWLAARRAPASAPAVAPEVPVTGPDATEIPWARNEEYFIVVSRSCRTLSVYRRGRLLRRYPAVFGQNPLGPKRFEGDLRTPAGFYTIVEKRPHRRWARFLLLDYPNSSDGLRYAAALEAGELPTGERGAPGMGGAVGIHGSDKEELNARGVDWTHGCISLFNRDALELSAIVPVGTPVWIAE